MNPKFMNVRDVMSELGVSKNKAYLVNIKIICGIQLLQYLSYV